MNNGWLPVYLVGATGCLVQNGQLNNNGYGPHRRLWIAEFGPVPKGMDLDHLCRNRWCINIDHLELVTRRENLARGKQSSRKDESKCRKGLHEWTDENTFIDAHGKTLCRPCHVEYHINYREQLRKRSGKGGA